MRKLLLAGCGLVSVLYLLPMVWSFGGIADGQAP